LKKLIGLISLGLLIAVMIGCDNREKLYILNWYDYINEDLVEEFEKEFGVNVVIQGVTSNELMYNLIETRAGKYDIVFPSEYMVQRMYDEAMLLELDFEKLPNYNVEIFDENLQSLRDTYFLEQQNYSIPYFWGTLGIMYNNAKPGVKEFVEEHEWGVFFDESIKPANVTVGMYDSSRDAAAAALFYLNQSPNPTSVAELTEAESLLVNYEYDFWGTDNLKEAVSTGNLDIALVYSGDYFDTVFFVLDSGDEPTFGMHVPTERNNVWFDTMAIPVTCEKYDLAHAFINFFLDYDNALENAAFVGYCPVRYDVYTAVLEDEELAPIVNHPGYYPGNVQNAEIYLTLDKAVADRMDYILTAARSN